MTHDVAIFKKIDCHSLPVSDLDAALSFYRDELGHKLAWRDASAAGLKVPESDVELVLHAEARPIETDFLVDSVPVAVNRFVRAGGKLITGPFEIRIGLCAVLQDPWGNRLVVLDTSKGKLEVDPIGNIVPRSE